MYEYTDLSRFQVVNLCIFWGIDFTMIEKAVENPNPATVVYFDLPVYYASKKENQVNSMNIGSEIVYITEKPIATQAVRVTRENIYHVAEWVGAKTLFTPIRKNATLGERVEPSFALPGGQVGHIGSTVTVGHWVVRDKNGRFSHTTEFEIRRRFDFPEKDEPHN